MQMKVLEEMHVVKALTTLSLRGEGDKDDVPCSVFMFQVDGVKAFTG